MFKDYSFPALQVIMVALRKAGQRGAVALEIDDLLVALIVADQGGAPIEIFDQPGRDASPAGLNPPRRFLVPEIAGKLLAQIESLGTKSEPIANNPELPISERLKRTLSAASSLREELHRKKVEPLHLLAAALEDDSNQAVQAFTEAGITRESVLEALKEEAAFREKPLIAVGTKDTVAVPLYSVRARNVNYLARLKARMRGSGSIEVEDLLVALLIEDQGGFLDALSETPGGIGIDITHIDLRPHSPALAASMANDLIAQVEALCNRSEPLPPDAAIQMSKAVKRIFAVADLPRDALQQREVEPLHLLAVILEERSDEAVQIVLEAGITPENVLKAIRSETK